MSLVMSLICSSHKHIHTTCAWYIQTLFLSWTLAYPLSPYLQLHDVQIPIFGSSQGALCIYSLSLHATQPSHAYISACSFSLTHLNSYMLHNYINILYCTEFIISCKMYSTTTQATTAAHYITAFIVLHTLFHILPHFMLKPQYVKCTLVSLASVCMCSREREYTS